MAARQFGRRAAGPALMVAGTMLMSRPVLHLESSEPHQVLRKPIYDDDVPIRNTAPLPSRPMEPSPIADQEKGMTADLASYVRQARIFTAVHVRLVEDRVNSAASRFFALENEVTTTIANLAPDARTTGEHVMPSALYVLVAGMAGQIATRRRNILLRASVPVLFAVGAANYLLPHTSANIADLVWSWEQRMPVLAENHVRARNAVQSAVRDAQQATSDARQKLDELVKQGRETVEGWIQQGK